MYRGWRWIIVALVGIVACEDRILATFQYSGGIQLVKLGLQSNDWVGVPIGKHIDGYKASGDTCLSEDQKYYYTLARKANSTYLIGFNTVTGNIDQEVLLPKLRTFSRYSNPGVYFVPNTGKILVLAFQSEKTSRTGETYQMMVDPIEGKVESKKLDLGGSFWALVGTGYNPSVGESYVFVVSNDQDNGYDFDWICLDTTSAKEKYRYQYSNIFGGLHPMVFDPVSSLMWGYRTDPKNYYHSIMTYDSQPKNFTVIYDFTGYNINDALETTMCPGKKNSTLYVLFYDTVHGYPFICAIQLKEEKVQQVDCRDCVNNGCPMGIAADCGIEQK